MKRVRVNSADQGRTRPDRPVVEEAPLSSNSGGFGLKFLRGRGILHLEKVTVGAGVTMSGLEMVIPRIAFPFDVSKGIGGLRHRRHKLAALDLSIEKDGVERAALAHRSQNSWVHNPKIAFEPDCISVLADYGPQGSGVPVSFRLLPVVRERRLVLLIDDVRGYGSLPQPLLTVGAFMVNELFGGPVEGVGLALPDPIVSALIEVLPRRGWRLPDTSGAELTHFAILPDRVELGFRDRSIYDEETALTPATMSMERLRRLERLRGLEAGDQLLSSGEIEQARAVYAEALERLPGNEALAARLSMIDMTSLTLVDKVEGYLCSSFDDYPERPELLAVLAQGAAVAGFAEREALYLEMMFKDSLPLEKRAIALRITELLGEQEPARCSRLLEQAQRTSQADVTTMRALLVLLAAMGDLERFIGVLPSWLGMQQETDGRSAQLYAGRLLLEQLKAPKQALPLLEQAALKNPDDRDAQFYLAGALAQIGESQRAIRGFERLLETASVKGDTDFAADVLAKLGELWLAKGEPQLAVVRLMESLGSRWNWSTQLMLARALVGAGRINEAIVNYEEALSRIDVRDKRYGQTALTVARLYISHLSDFDGAARWVAAAKGCVELADEVGILEVQVLEKQGRWDELAALLEQRLVSFPVGTGADQETLETVLGLVKARLAANEPTSALGTARSALERYPDNPALLSLYVEAARAAKQHASLVEGLKRLHVVLQKGEERAAVALEIGQLKLEQFESPREALYWFDAALGDDQTLLDARVGVVAACDRLGASGRLPGALEQLALASEQSGQLEGAARAFVRLGEMFLDGGEVEKGIELLRRGLPNLEKGARTGVLLMLAGALFEQGDFSQAAELYERARLEGGGANSQLAALGQAESALKIGDYEGAFESALAAGSGAPEFRGRAARVLAAAAEPLGRVEEATQVLLRVAENESPQMAGALLCQVAELNWRVANDVKSARRYFEQALEILPDDEGARNRLLTLYEESGDRLALARGLVRFADKGPAPVADLKRGADFLLAEERYEEAACALRSAHERSPDAESARMLGRALLRIDQGEEAAAVLAPFALKDQGAWEMLAGYYRQSGQDELLEGLLKQRALADPAGESDRLLSLAALARGRSDVPAQVDYMLSAARLIDDDARRLSIVEEAAGLAADAGLTDLLEKAVSMVAFLDRGEILARWQLALLRGYGARGLVTLANGLLAQMDLGALSNEDLLSVALEQPGLSALRARAMVVAQNSERWSDLLSLLDVGVARTEGTERIELTRTRAMLLIEHLNRFDDGVTQLMDLAREGALDESWLERLGGLLERPGWEVERLDLLMLRAGRPDASREVLVEGATLARELGRKDVVRRLRVWLVERFGNLNDKMALLDLLDDEVDKTRVAGLLDDLWAVREELSESEKSALGARFLNRAARVAERADAVLMLERAMTLADIFSDGERLVEALKPLSDEVLFELDPKVVLSVARACVANGAPARGRRLLVWLAERSGDDPDMLLGLADCGWALEDMGMVSSRLERLRLVAPQVANDPRHLYRLAVAVARTGQWPPADIVEMLERIMSALDASDKEAAATLLASLKSGKYIK